jgi:hypothetical protein
MRQDPVAASGRGTALGPTVPAAVAEEGSPHAGGSAHEEAPAAGGYRHDGAGLRGIPNAGLIADRPGRAAG